MSPSVLFLNPPALPGTTANREGSAGMGVSVETAGAFTYPPYLLASCAAVMRGQGWRVAGLDAAALALDFAQTLDRLPAADLLVVPVSYGTLAADRAFLNELRRRKPLLKVLAVGPSLSYRQVDHVFSDLVDLMVAGEPEMALPAAARRLLAGEERPGRVINPYELAPAAYWPAGLLADLNSLPLPAWDIFDGVAYPFLTILSSRGCPAGCGFCPYVAAQGLEHRIQSPARTANEMAFLAQDMNARRVMFRDPVFARDRSRVLALSSELLRLALPVSWECESRPEHFDTQLLSSLHAAGCDTVKIGLESGDPELLAAIGRVRDEADGRAYLEQVTAVVAACRQIGITCRVFVMVGLPDQSPQSVARTADFLRQLRPARLHVKHYGWYPGVALSHGGDDDWTTAAAQLRAAASPRTRAGGRRRDGFCVLPRNGPPMAEMHCAFVTGGDGFVGSHVVRQLLARGVRVRALTRTGAAATRPDLPDGVEWVTGDLLEPAGWREQMHGCDAVFHVAAFYSPRPADAPTMHAINVSGTRNVMQAAAASGVTRVVHTSTVGVVGRPADGSLPDENTPFNLWSTGSEYVRSKWLGEAAALLWTRRGLDVVVVQPTAPVGAGDTKPTATGQRFADFVAGRRPDYPTGGMNLCPVQDIAVGHILAAELGQAGQRYILGHHEGNLSEGAFLALLSEVSGLPVPAAAQRSGGRRPSSLTADPGRAIEELGLPQSSLRAAFADAVATYRRIA